MNHLAVAALLAAALAGVTPATAHAGSSSGHGDSRPFMRLVPTGTYDTGLAGNGAEIISVRQKDAIAAVTNVRAASCGADTGAVDILDLSRPAQPKLLRRVCIAPSQTAAGAPNSVAVHPTQDYFLVVVGSSGAQGVVAAYRLSDGAFLASSPAGILPDSVAISPNGRFAVVANEAEGTGVGANGGPGSLKDGEKVNHKLLAAKLAALQESGVRVFVLPGNHDVENPDAIDFRTSPPVPAARVTPREFARIYEEFGYEDAISRDPASLSYLAEPVPGLWLFALDSVRYEDNRSLGEPVTAGAIRPQTLAWATHWLGEARRRGKVAIGMMHHGLIEHFAGQSQQFPEYLVADRQTLGDALAAAGLHLVFTGHFHANDAVSRPTPWGTQYDVETGSLVTAPSPYRLVKADLSARRFGIATSRVTSIPSHPADFVPDSTGFLVSGLSGITMAQLTSPPFNLPPAVAAQIAPLVVGGFVAHYAGDEVAPAAVTLTVTLPAPER